MVVACHVVLVLPFVLRSVYVSLRNLDRRLELAAASLGAPPHRVLITVTLPLLLPGLVSGWLFAAILSFNEFTASLFVTAQRTQTLPVAMYNYVREYADPVDGGDLGHLHRAHRDVADVGQCLPRSRKGAER